MYQPIKSVTSLKLALDAFIFPVLFLYQSQVGFVICAYPKAVDGLEVGIKPRNFFLFGFANWVKDDSCFITANWNAIGVFHLP